MIANSALVQFLATNPLPWLKYDAAKDKYIFVLDNHLMSTYRACPQHFINRHVLGLARKGRKENASTRVWFLEFGVILHEVFDHYYKTYKNPDWKIDELVSFAVTSWHKNEMDEFSEEKEYNTIGGLKGFLALVIQYATVMGPLNDSFRVLGTEVSFGKNKEVLLSSNDTFELYLSGRIDLIIDDGYFICPVDHKSFASFKKDPVARYFTDEGPTGYVFALKTVLPSLVPEEMILKRDCSKIVMNLISKAPTTNPADRFKRETLRKTEWQLEQYRQRMVATMWHILSDMANVVHNSSVPRNTQLCDSWFHRECTYKDICRQNSRDGELATIQNGFMKTPLWDTELLGNE